MYDCIAVGLLFEKTSRPREVVSINVALDPVTQMWMKQLKEVSDWAREEIVQGNCISNCNMNFEDTLLKNC